MGPSGKWIEGIVAVGSVEDAARCSLEVRLTGVAQRLPLAAHLAEHDVEHVHRLRVSTRRAVAALKLYRDWLPRGKARWLKKRLKKIRRAAGDARDLDVLAERLSRDYGERIEPVMAIIKERRAAVQPDIIDVAERCRRDDRFVRKTAKLIEGVRPSNGSPDSLTCFREWAVKQLASATAPFFNAVPDETADAAALHQFRIRAKALRYTIELVASAFGPELRDSVYPVVEEIQERLGRVQDHVTAGALLRKWADDESDTSKRELLGEVAADECNQLDAAIREFREWWTSERAEVLRNGLPSVTRESATECPAVVHQT
jgi:CHAD domain-containing protein